MSVERGESAAAPGDSRGRVLLRVTALASAFVAFFTFFAVLSGLPNFRWDWTAPVEVGVRTIRFEIAEAWMFFVPAFAILTVSVLTMLGSMIYLVSHPLPGGDPPDTVYYL